MTQLELVKHEQVLPLIMKRTVVAVSSSHSALVEHCEEIGGQIGEVGCGESKYYTIQESDIVIIPSKF